MIVSRTNHAAFGGSELLMASENVKVIGAAAEGGPRLDELPRKPLGLFDPAIRFLLPLILQVGLNHPARLQHLRPHRQRRVFSPWCHRPRRVLPAQPLPAIKGPSEAVRSLNCADVPALMWHGFDTRLRPSCPNNSCVSQAVGIIG